ncbi:hypothetical protein PGT21_007599 [Puccinia graminis f. sp. tritici]|uniref:Uncharacterized protein n=1 Tax=Puccinia graminis f. sp. tritici TaxID=56615 RepID=A0A5B0PHU6_PUCGR|nr:hypothetical protein PGT21_007599 [Puccinia graminis f. sp. tritici]KAA1123241.1 hypothetical protein PGTUg99_014424 [Puccinia graminis f. sp. tritici]
MQKIWRVRWLASLYLHLLSALVRGGLHQLVDVALSLKDEQGHNTIAFSAIGLGKPIKTLMLFDDSGLEESSEGRNGRSPLLKSIREIKDEDHDFQPALKRTKLDLNLSLAPMLDQNPADIPIHPLLDSQDHMALTQISQLTQLLWVSTVFWSILESRKINHLPERTDA